MVYVLRRRSFSFTSSRRSMHWRYVPDSDLTCKCPQGFIVTATNGALNRPQRTEAYVVDFGERVTADLGASMHVTT
jgi:hypothetical protein